MKRIHLTLYRARLATLEGRAEGMGGKLVAKSGQVVTFEIPEARAAAFAREARLDNARHVTIEGGLQG